LDGGGIKAKTEILLQSSMKLGEAMYKAQEAGAGAPGGDAQSGPADPGVVDADFEEVDGDKKNR
ncbi:MAG: hypothetical protein EPN20_01130, partial [Magnetospirillum sp.]